MTPLRVVIDTNVYVSRFLRPNSIPGKAVEKAWVSTRTLISVATSRELREVLHRPKFAPYVQVQSVDDFVRKVVQSSESVLIAEAIRACRDPGDDKFIELAVHGRADIVISGDQDLLALHPFRGIDLLTPAQFLALDSKRP